MVKFKAEFHQRTKRVGRQKEWRHTVSVNVDCYSTGIKKFLQKKYIVQTSLIISVIIDKCIFFFFFLFVMSEKKPYRLPYVTVKYFFPVFRSIQSVLLEYDLKEALLILYFLNGYKPIHVWNVFPMVIIYFLFNFYRVATLLHYIEDWYLTLNIISYDDNCMLNSTGNSCKTVLVYECHDVSNPIAVRELLLDM